MYKRGNPKPPFDCIIMTKVEAHILPFGPPTIMVQAAFADSGTELVFGHTSEVQVTGALFTQATIDKFQAFIDQAEEDLGKFVLSSEGTQLSAAQPSEGATTVGEMRGIGEGG